MQRAETDQPRLVSPRRAHQPTSHVDAESREPLRAFTSPTLRSPPSKATSGPSAVSAASNRRLSNFVSIEHRALPASPTYKRSRQSGTRSARLDSTAYSGSEAGLTPGAHVHRGSLGQIDFSFMPQTPQAIGPGDMSQCEDSSTILRSELHLPHHVEDYAPAAAATVGGRALPAVVRIPPLDAVTLRDHEQQQQMWVVGPTPGRDNFDAKMSVLATRDVVSARSPGEEGDLNSDVHGEVLRDFYESELLLYRNFGIDIADAAAPGGDSRNSRRGSQQLLAPPSFTFEGSSPIAPHGGSSFNQLAETLSASGSHHHFSAVAPPPAAMRRRSNAGGTLSPVPPAPVSEYDTERRSALRRRGSHSAEVSPMHDATGSPLSQASHSPHHGPQQAAATLLPGFQSAHRGAKSPMRQRGDSPPQRAASTSHHRQPQPPAASCCMSVTTAAAEDGAIFEIIAPVHVAISHDSSSSHHSPDASSRLSPVNAAGVRSRTGSTFVAFADGDTGTFDIEAPKAALPISSSKRDSVSNNSFSGAMGTSSAGASTRRRGSWLETADGAPRALTSSNRRAVKGIAVVDMEQEFLRYTNKNRTVAAGQEWDGACGCDEDTIGRHIGKISVETIDASSMFHHCSWCQRRPSSFLCLHCGQTVCPSHVKAHAEDDGMQNCVLFVNTLDITTSFDRIYWCERCTSFTYKFTDAYCAVADALVTTRKTYLQAPATDIFIHHYQIMDRAETSLAFAAARADAPTSPGSLPVEQAAAAGAPSASGTFSPDAKNPAPPPSQGLGVRMIASVASMQGWRSTQEDSEVVFYLPLSSLPIDPAEFGGAERLPATQFTVFCVFDGHGGDAVAKLAANNIESHFVQSMVKQLEARRGSLVEDPNFFVANERRREAFYKDVLVNAFIDLDTELAESPDGLDGFYGTVGCTALVVVVTPLDIVCASAGDSRACLFDVHRSRTHALSVDHTLDDEGEARRVVEAGYMLRDGRIEGQLAVPRALGDFDFKMCGGKGPGEQAVSCVPDVHLIPRTQLRLAEGELEAMSSSVHSKLPPMSGSPTRAAALGTGGTSPTHAPPPPLPEEWFIVLGCDGIWETFSNEDCCAQLQESFASEKRQRQLEQYLNAMKLSSVGMDASSASPDHSPTVSMAGSIPVGRRSRHSSMRSGHPSANQVLYANTLSDIVAASICGVLKKGVAADAEAGEGKGMDNMSIIVARLALAA